MYAVKLQHQPLKAASLVIPISLAKSSALIEVYALDTKSNVLF